MLHIFNQIGLGAYLDIFCLSAISRTCHAASAIFAKYYYEKAQVALILIHEDFTKNAPLSELVDINRQLISLQSNKPDSVRSSILWFIVNYHKGNMWVINADNFIITFDKCYKYIIEWNDWSNNKMLNSDDGKSRSVTDFISKERDFVSSDLTYIRFEDFTFDKSREYIAVSVESISWKYICSGLYHYYTAQVIKDNIVFNLFYKFQCAAKLALFKVSPLSTQRRIFLYC